jgi:hypothetical protein
MEPIAKLNMTGTVILTKEQSITDSLIDKNIKAIKRYSFPCICPLKNNETKWKQMSQSKKRS